MISIFRTLAACSLLLAFAVPSQAGLIYYSDRGVFSSAAPGLPVEDFELGNVASGSVVGCPSPLDSTSNNACFATGSILPGIQFASSSNPVDGIALVGPGFYGPPSKAIFANYFVDTLSINLLAPANAIGFDVYSLFVGSTIQISIYAPGGTLLGSASVLASTAPAFFGVISDGGPIGSLTLASLSGQAEGIDNVAFGNASAAIPEPGTLSLLGVALLVLPLLRRGK